MKLFRIHNPNYLSELLPIRQPDPRGASGIRFQAGTLQDIRKLTEQEWEESKRKALRWKSEGR